MFAQEVMEKVDHILVCAFFLAPLSKVNELDEEKMKTEEALHDFLPVSVVRSMKVQIEPNLTQPGLSKSDLIQPNQSVSDNKKDQDI